jgi:hypothetical protein
MSHYSFQTESHIWAASLHLYCFSVVRNASQFQQTFELCKIMEPLRNSYLSHSCIFKCCMHQLGKLSCMLVWILWINSVRTFTWLSIQSITCSILNVLRIIVSLINKYSAWKGKVLLNKWGLMKFLKCSNANWTWQWKYYHWFTFFDLVNTYRQMWPFLFTLYRPPHPSLFFFRTPDKANWGFTVHHCMVTIIVWVRYVVLSSWQTNVWVRAVCMFIFFVHSEL